MWETRNMAVCIRVKTILGGIDDCSDCFRLFRCLVEGEPRYILVTNSESLGTLLSSDPAISEAPTPLANYFSGHFRALRIPGVAEVQTTGWQNRSSGHPPNSLPLSPIYSIKQLRRMQNSVLPSNQGHITRKTRELQCIARANDEVVSQIGT